jgi:hypothetical protein
MLPAVPLVLSLLHASYFALSADQGVFKTTIGGHPLYVESATDSEVGMDADIPYDDLPRAQRHRSVSGFDNFGNLLRYDGLHELAGEDVEMDHCLSEGCNPEAWSLTVVVPFFKRISRLVMRGASLKA